MRTLKLGVAAPPLPNFQRGKEPMVHRFLKRPLLNVEGALQYAYVSQGAPLQSLVGPGSGVRTGAPLGYGQKPMVALPTVGQNGMAYVPGQFAFSPLSDYSPNEVVKAK